MVEQAEARAILHINEKWSVEYHPALNDSPGRVLRYGEPTFGGSSDWKNDTRAMFYALLERDARIAALEAQLAARTGGVKVKPLEWTISCIGAVKARTEVGDYEAEWSGEFFEIVLNTWATLPGFEVREWMGKDGEDGAESRAKAAAQADYEQRILSALSPAPEAQQEPVADCHEEAHDHPSHDWRPACLKCGIFSGSDIHARRALEGGE